MASAVCFTLRLHTSAAPPQGGLTQALDAMKKLSAIGLMALVMVAACTEQTASQSPVTPPQTPSPPPDFSFLEGSTKHCSARLVLAANVSAAERCWIETLSARCNVGDDCLVSCLASGQAQNIGGGCWHVCSQPPTRLTDWSEPASAEECRSIGRVNGI